MNFHYCLWLGLLLSLQYMGTKGYVIFAMGTIIFKALVLVKSLPLLYYHKVDFVFYRGLHIKIAQCCTNAWPVLLVT